MVMDALKNGSPFQWTVAMSLTELEVMTNGGKIPLTRESLDRLDSDYKNGQEAIRKLHGIVDQLVKAIPDRCVIIHNDDDWTNGIQGIIDGTGIRKYDPEDAIAWINENVSVGDVTLIEVDAANATIAVFSDTAHAAGFRLRFG